MKYRDIQIDQTYRHGDGVDYEYEDVTVIDVWVTESDCGLIVRPTNGGHIFRTKGDLISPRK